MCRARHTQNAGEGPGLLRGLLEVPGSEKFNFLSGVFGFKKPGPSAPRYGATRCCMIVCIGGKYKTLNILGVSPPITLGERATVAQMTGCEASPTMYRIGFEWRQENPSGNPIRLRDRVGQYGKINRRALSAVSERLTYWD